LIVRTGVSIFLSAKRNFSTSKKDTSVITTDAHKKGECPECGGEMIQTGGCKECLDCGYSPCSI
jgi:hypothetical protein